MTLKPAGILVTKHEDGTYTKIDIATMSEDDQEKYARGNLWSQSLPNNRNYGESITANDIQASQNVNVSICIKNSNMYLQMYGAML